MNNEVGELLRYCRNQAGLSQRDLAERLHVDRTIVTKIETGSVAQPSYAIVKEWGKATGHSELIATHMAGGGWKEVGKLQQAMGQMKTLFESLNFMRRKKDGRQDGEGRQSRNAVHEA